jgi:hypothetical protein
MDATVEAPTDGGGVASQHADVFVEAIRSIGRSIAALKPIYPQLADFDVERNVSPDHLWITYKYRTTRSKRPGGWTAQVPNPESDGVWFYVDFHDHDSTSQIHTQPFTGRFAFRDKSVSFLILEGPRTKSLQPAIWKILRQHGVESLPL